jgi:hypothetical protein
MEAPFHVAMAAVTTDQELHMGPLKGFPRIMEKTHEYVKERNLTSWRDRVLAPMYVIDILRCTVQVETVERALQVEEALLKTMALARAKNGHSVDLVEVPGGYRDQKLNLILESEGLFCSHFSRLCVALARG